MGYPLNAYGLAARSDRDGIDVWGFPHGPWGKAPDVEDIESEFPLLHLYQKQQRDTCGFGKYRGGLGAAVGYIVYQTPHLAFTSSQKESLFPAHNGLYRRILDDRDPRHQGARRQHPSADGGRRAAPAHRRLHARQRRLRAGR